APAPNPSSAPQCGMRIGRFSRAAARTLDRRRRRGEMRRQHLNRDRSATYQPPSCRGTGLDLGPGRTHGRKEVGNGSRRSPITTHAQGTRKRRSSETQRSEPSTRRQVMKQFARTALGILVVAALLAPLAAGAATAPTGVVNVNTATV